MRPHHIVVVAVVVLLACVGHASGSADSNVVIAPDFPTSARALTENRNDPPTKRLLRTANLATEDAEERVFGVEKVTNAVKSATANLKLKMDIRTWLKEGQSADFVSTRLIHDKNVDSVLSNPNFNALAKYVDKFNKKNPNDKVSMIDVLTRRYGEAAVSKMLVAAKNVPSREEWAIKLQVQQVEGWLNTDQTAVNVFRILHLDDAATFPLRTRNLKAWQNYVTILTKEKPEQATTMFDTFRRVYTDNGLARLIDAPEQQRGVGLVAMALKTSLFRRWKHKKITKAEVNTKIFGLKDGDEIDEAATRIIAQYGKYLDDGSLYLVMY